MKLLRTLVPGLLLALAATPARAGPPPIGAWVSARGAQLVVSDHATCAYAVPNATAEGECIWRQSESGGILMIHYQAQTPTGQPTSQVLYLDIRWINQTTISVTGEQFRRTRW